MIEVGEQKVTIPEALFNPSVVGLTDAGIPELIYRCVMLLPEDDRQALCSNICVVGGGSLIPGFVERLEH